VATGDPNDLGHRCEQSSPCAGEVAGELLGLRVHNNPGCITSRRTSERLPELVIESFESGQRVAVPAPPYRPDERGGIDLTP
jgi:hypothetical protein